MATAGVDVVVGLGDLVQRVAVADVDGEGADGGGGGEVAGGLALCLGGKSSLPSSRRVTLLNSSGQKGISVRSERVA